jgi:hypothetical protein
VKRFALGPVAAVLLLILLPLTLSSCDITCGCASTPDPNWTPAPVNAQQASQDAAKFASVPSTSAAIVAGLDGRYFYRATATNVLAFVDAESGFVLELVFTDQMPNDTTASKTEADARGAAEVFMSGVGMATEGMTESVQLKTVAGVSAYEIIWNDAGGVHAGKFEVSVNAATGSVFAYVDLRMQLALTPPIVGSARATTLAIAAAGMPGGVARSVSFGIDFATGAELSAWAVTVGVPGTTTVSVVAVDAVTGTVTVPTVVTPPPAASAASLSGASPSGASPTPEVS